MKNLHMAFRMLKNFRFALVAIITATISLLTLIYQTVKAARTNPATAMKLE